MAADVKEIDKRVKAVEKKLDSLKNSFDKHERLGNKTVELLLSRIKKKKPVKLDKLEGDVGELAKDVDQLEGLDKDFSNLKSEFDKFKATSDEEFEEIINELKKVNKQLSKHKSKVESIDKKGAVKVPVPPLAPSIEKRLGDIETEMTDIMDIANAAKEISDSSRSFMDEVDDQLTAVMKMLEEHKSIRIQAEGDIVGKIDLLNKSLSELRRGFSRLAGDVGDIGSKVSVLLNLRLELEDVKNKLERIEKAGFGALIIE